MNRRTIALLLSLSLALAVAAPPPALAAGIQNDPYEPRGTPPKQPDPPKQEPDRGRDSSVRTRNAVLAGLLGLGAAALIARGKGPRKKLAKEGPRIPDVHSMSDLRIEGFVRADWPLVVEYQTQPDAVALLTIELPGRSPVLFRLDPAGGERQQTILRLPTDLPRRPEIGLYTIRAFADSMGSPQPVPMRVYAVGAGPRAVGSVAIDQLLFEAAQKERGKVDFGFRSRSDFRRTEAEFLRVESDRGELLCEYVDGKPMGGIKSNKVVRDRWNGKNGKGRSNGWHALRVRAWSSLDDGDWVAAWSDDLVELR